MPAHKNKYIDVNLLPKDAFAQSGVGKMLNWALSTGRYIVVFTEMVVILTFLSRFTLDRQLTDLNESILKKQTVMNSYANIETIVRQVQAKAEFIEENEGDIKTVELLNFLSNIAPSDIVFDQLSVQFNQFTLNGTAYSLTSLSEFVDDIRADDTFTDVISERIETTQRSSGVTFVLRAKFNEVADSESE